MTHLYTLFTGGHVVPAGDDAGTPGATAIVVAAGTVLLVGTDEEARSVSRGDSMAVELAGAIVRGVGRLEIGAPADFDVLGAVGEGGVIARIRGGSLVEGDLPGWRDHEDGDHEPSHQRA